MDTPALTPRLNSSSEVKRPPQGDAVTRSQPSRVSPFWSSKIFLSVLVLKIVASFLFTASYLTEFFTPFINWHVLSGFQNPWEFFYEHHLTRMFPYPTVMLWVMTLPRIIFWPFLSGQWQTVTALHLFVMRIPLLLFDVLLLTQLLKFFPNKQQRLLLIYWCSPIVFFINYLHGQLDIIPTAIFFLSIYLLIQSRYFASVLLLAVAVACKTHLLITLPFIWMFLYRRQVGIPKLISCLGFFGLVYFALLLPYIGSHAFREMVFHSPEQDKFFAFTLPISSSTNLIICPTVLTLLFTKFASYKKLNREILLMFLGIVFASLVVFVPPRPGWFMWSLPFLIYFYMSNRDYSRAPFVLYNAVYLVYFLFFSEERLPFLNRAEGLFPIRDFALSVVMSSVGFIAFWMFKLGINKNEQLKVLEAPLLIGIGGDSGAGKRTLSKALRNLVGKSRSISVFGDDFHKWERGDEHWQVYTHLNPSANRLHESMDLAVALKEGQSVELGHYDHKTGKFSQSRKIEPNKFIFFVGLHPFYLKKMRDQFHVKVFVDTDETLRKCWKLRRDTLKRGYPKSQVIEQITSRHEDQLRYIEPQKTFADLIVRYEPRTALDLDPSPDGKTPLRTTYVLDNSISLEDLMKSLSRIDTLEIEYRTTVSRQELIVKGTVTARQVMNTALELGFDFDELFTRSRGWLSDCHGITQLVFLIVHNHKMKV